MKIAASYGGSLAVLSGQRGFKSFENGDVTFRLT
jgi:hypothetical protein